MKKKMLLFKDYGCSFHQPFTKWTQAPFTFRQDNLVILFSRVGEIAEYDCGYGFHVLEVINEKEIDIEEEIKWIKN